MPRRELHAGAEAVRVMPLRLSSLKSPPIWPKDWLGFEALTHADRAALWIRLLKARPWLHARRMMSRA